MLFFETGLHDFIREARVTYYVRVSLKAYQYAKESDPEIHETIDFLLKDKSKDKWTVTSLNINQLKSAFSLSVWSFIMTAIILLFEILLSSLFNSFIIYLINIYLNQISMI